MQSSLDDVLTLGRDQEAQYELRRPSQAASRSSLREINAIVRSLGIHALGREDYCILLDGRMGTRGERFARKLTLRRRRRVIAAHRLPAWWGAVITEPEHARDLLLIALFTGMRQSKVIALRWDCIDLVGKVLYFPQNESGNWFGLPMSDFLAELIIQRRRIVGWSDWVFPGRGHTGHIAEIKSIVKRVAGRSAVPFTWQALQRTFITIATNLDVPAYTLKRLLGHGTDDDTAGYIVGDVEWLRDPVQRIADRILGLARPHERWDVSGPRGLGETTKWTFS
jgi:integrase